MFKRKLKAHLDPERYNKLILHSPACRDYYNKVKSDEYLQQKNMGTLESFMQRHEFHGLFQLDLEEPKIVKTIKSKFLDILDSPYEYHEANKALVESIESQKAEYQRKISWELAMAELVEKYREKIYWIFDSDRLLYEDEILKRMDPTIPPNVNEKDVFNEWIKYGLIREKKIGNGLDFRNSPSKPPGYVNPKYPYEIGMVLISGWYGSKVKIEDGLYQKWLDERNIKLKDA